MVKTTQERFGATVEDWSHFDLTLGLTPDLLPVVSNPQAVISSESKMRDVGKTPSIYNKSRKVSGLPGWTGYEATSRDVDKWSSEPDYGICLQTRLVRAIDVDVTDPELATAIERVLLAKVLLPKRFRANSSKFLLGFQLEGEFGKRKITTSGGIIEFLANGQQFIAAGTHPTGFRYQWDGSGLPDFPTLSVEQFEAIWGELVQRFAIEPPTESRATKRRGEMPDVGEVNDPVVDFLEERAYVKGYERDGRLHIVCPFEDEHTSESSDSSTTYFPAGTGGYEVGHFKCLHAHCEGRSDHEFLDRIGFIQTEFAELPVEHTEREPLPGFRRKKSGAILSTIENVYKACCREDVCGLRISFDTFRDELMAAEPDTDDWRPFYDADYSRIRITLERLGFESIGRELIRDAVGLVASEREFDSATKWLSDLTWDGVPRIERFYSDLFGAEDSAYVRAASRYTWTALAGRVLEPGVKADMVPILIGLQGIGKSSAVSAMVPDPQFYTEIALDANEDNLARKMRGVLIGEIGELRGLNSREIEHIKSFITRTHEKWTPKFKEFATTYPRRLLFIGTTNQDEFLADETGNRRWLPIKVHDVDLATLRKERLQLWAEGAELFKKGGVDYVEVSSLAGEVHREHVITDVWEPKILEWLNEVDFADSEEKTNGEKPICVTTLLVGALGFDVKHIKKAEEMRAARVLKSLNFTRKTLRVGGSQVKRWVRGE